MILQIIGAGLVLGATLWTGAYFAAREKYRLKELEELEQGLLLLKGQIEYLSAPLPEVLENVAWKTGGIVGEGFQKASSCMARREGGSAEEIWEAVWREQFPHSYFTGEDMEAVLQFGKTLGYLDKAQQEGNIELFRRYLEKALEKGRRRLEKNGRLYYGMGALSGLLLVTILI